MPLVYIKTLTFQLSLQQTPITFRSQFLEATAPVEDLNKGYSNIITPTSSGNRAKNVPPKVTGQLIQLQNTLIVTEPVFLLWTNHAHTQIQQ